MADWQDIGSPKSSTSDEGWEDVAQKKQVEAFSIPAQEELPSHPGGEAFVLPKMGVNFVGGGLKGLYTGAREALSGLDASQVWQDVRGAINDPILKPWGKEEAKAGEELGKAFEKGADITGRASELSSNLTAAIQNIVRHTVGLSTETDEERMKRQAEARTSGEVAFNVAPMALGGLFEGKPKGTTKPAPHSGPTLSEPFKSSRDGDVGFDFGKLSDQGRMDDNATGHTPLDYTSDNYNSTNQVAPPQPIEHDAIPYVPVTGLDAAQKPGFLRSAEETMQAREIDRISRGLNPTGTYAKEGLPKLEEKQALDYQNAKPDKQPMVIERDAEPVSKDIVDKAERMVAKDPNAEFIPLELARELRSHDRLTDPKGSEQFKTMEDSVVKNAINQPLEFEYNKATDQIVQVNGHTRVAMALKHGLTEIPGKITVVDDPRGFIDKVTGSVDHQGNRMAMDVPRTPTLKPGQKNVTFSELGFKDARKPNKRAGLLSKVPKGQRGMFIGLEGVANDLSSLGKHLKFTFAKKLEQQGFGKKTIYDQTGWFRGLDGEWRREISDAGSAIKSANLDVRKSVLDWNGPAHYSIPEKGVKLGDILHHPELFKHYPEFRDVWVQPERNSSNRGSWNPNQLGSGYIRMGRLDPKQFKSTLLHEIQHAIQQKEGFFRGGSTSEFIPERVRILEKDRDSLHTWLNKKLEEAGISNEEKIVATTRIQALMRPEGNQMYFQSHTPTIGKLAAKSLEKVSKAGLLRPMIQLEESRQLLEKAQQSAIDQYKAIPGEVEARTTQRRMDLGEAQRAGRYPWQDYDVPADQQKPAPGDSISPSAMELVPKDDPVKEALSKNISKKGIVKSVIDASKQFMTYGGKKLKDVLDGIPAFKDPENLKDITEKFQYSTNLQIDRGISVLAERMGPVGDIIKWVVDSRKYIDRMAEKEIENALKGDKFTSGKGLLGALGRGFEHRQWGDEGALGLWRKTPHAEISEMMKAWWDAVGKSVVPDFKTERQKQIFAAVQKEFDKALNQVNDMRAAKGLPAIQKIPNYFPGMRMGDYRIVVKDGAGKVIGYFGRNNIWSARKLAKQLQKRFPEHTVEDPYAVRSSKYDVGDMEMFEKALRVMKSDEPATKALQAAYTELVGKRGFGKHAIQREGVYGALGMEEGAKGAREAEQAMEYYIKKSYSYIGNLKKGDLLSQLSALPLEIRQKIPNAMKFAQEYLENSRGGSLGSDNFETEFAKFIGKEFGIGEGGIKRGIGTVNSFMQLWWLGTAKFLFGQTLQGANAFAKMVHLYQTTPYFKNPVINMMNGLARTIMPDVATRDLVNWASKEGHLAPAVVELIRTKLDNTLSRPAELVRNLTSASLGMIERELVRTPTLIAFEYGLRESIPDKVTRFQTAAELMRHYMVEYDKASSPMMYQKAGIFGDIARPMKQYSHNAFAQFFEYVQIATHEKNIAPLATMMGTQALIGGLRGTILVAEAGVVIGLVNILLQQANVPYRVPTPEEAIVRWGSDGWKKAAAFGMPSYMLGQDMSHTLGAPDMPNMFEVPTVEFVGKPLTDLMTYALHKVGGVDTEADKMKAMKDVSPNIMHPWIDQFFTATDPNQPTLDAFLTGPDKGMVPNANRNMSAMYRRSSSEWAWDKWFGGQSINETRFKEISGFMKQDLSFIAKERLNAVDAITDRLLYGKQIEPDLFQAYIRQGGSPENLMRDIKSAIVRHNLDPYQQELNIRSVNPAAARKLDAMKKYMDANPSNLTQDDKSGSGGGGGSFVMPISEPLTQSEQKALDDLNQQNRSPEVIQHAAALRAQEIGYDRLQMQKLIGRIEEVMKFKNLTPTQQNILKNERMLWMIALNQFGDNGKPLSQMKPKQPHQYPWDSDLQKYPDSNYPAIGRGGATLGNVPGAGAQIPEAASGIKALTPPNTTRM